MRKHYNSLPAGSGGQPLQQSLLLAPFQFDWCSERLIGSNGFSEKLPAPFVEVVKGWFERIPGTKAVFSSMDYERVATLYARGLVEKLQGARKEKKQQALEKTNKILDEPEYYALRFSSDFARWLRRRGIAKEEVFFCDRSNCLYALGTGWHKTKPVLNHSAPGLLPDYTRGNSKEGATIGQEEEEDSY